MNKAKYGIIEFYHGVLCHKYPNMRLNNASVLHTQIIREFGDRLNVTLTEVRIFLATPKEDYETESRKIEYSKTSY